MAQRPLALFIRCLTWWNYTREWFSFLVNTCSVCWHHTSHHLRGNHMKWFLLSGHTLPLSSLHAPSSMHAPWTYDARSHRLISKQADVSHPIKLAWLSVKLVVTTEYTVTEYDMDAFFQIFRIYTEERTPTLYDIFLCWCIFNKQWFATTDHISFYVIDHLGEERTIELDKGCCMEICDHKLYDNIQKN
jgi:hypothetical protein